MTPSNAIKARILVFAEEWVATQQAPCTVRAKLNDTAFLCACIEEIVDEAVREAILTTAAVFKEEAQ